MSIIYIYIIKVIKYNLKRRYILVIFLVLFNCCGENFFICFIVLFEDYIIFIVEIIVSRVCLVFFNKYFGENGYYYIMILYCFKI